MMAQGLSWMLDKEALQTFCARMNVPYDSLPGTIKLAKVKGLLGHFLQENRLPELMLGLYTFLKETAPDKIRPEFEAALFSPPGAPAAKAPARFECAYTYTIYGSGDVLIEHHVVPEVGDLPFLPRIGLTMTLPGGYEHFAWYGRGPHENYCDRKLGAAVGVYQSTVSEQYTPYVYPSECGGKEDARWLALRDSAGNGLLVVGQDTLHFDALHYSIIDLTTAGHCEASGKGLVTPAREEVILHLDARHMGVGGDDGWMSPVHKEFVIFPGLYRFAFKLKPLTSQDDPAAVARVKIEGEF
jgi:hypothetical protein